MQCIKGLNLNWEGLCCPFFYLAGESQDRDRTQDMLQSFYCLNIGLIIQFLLHAISLEHSAALYLCQLTGNYFVKLECLLDTHIPKKDMAQYNR